MSLVKHRDTKPEFVVRRLVSGLGYRYRLNYKKLPGRPDLALPGRRKAILVHGCFWHRHPAPGCPLARLPKSRLDFWLPKLESNRSRDLEKERQLQELGYTTLVIWECELGGGEKMDALRKRVKRFLEGKRGVH
jgi:DNA mismatch endonuclease (patch repair protein)